MFNDGFHISPFRRNSARRWKEQWDWIVPQRSSGKEKRVLKAKKKKEIAIETGWHPNDGGRLPCYYTILYSVVRAFVSTEPNDGSFESAEQETQGSDVRVMVTPNRHTNKKTKDLNRHSYLQRIPSRSPF